MIARKLGITVGSLTTSMNSLVNKKYVVRERSEADRRIVYIRLTPKGEKAYRHHEEFHKKMVESVVENPGQFLLSVAPADGGRRVLVPLVDALVVGLDEDARRIDVDLPDGLLDL